MPSVDLYDSRSLTKAINKLKVTEPFVLNNVFSTKEFHNADKVDIEIINGSEKIAHFVHANEPNPRPVAKLTKTIKTVTLPRTYESKVFTAQELADINSIGNIYSNPDEKARAQAEKISAELGAMKDRVIRLREKMACEALDTGKITVNLDNINFEVDFEFVATKQTITYTGTDLWTNASSKPLTLLQTWKRNIAKASGLNADILILGSAAAAAFIGNAEVLKALDANNNKIGQLDLTGKMSPAAMFIGRIMGVDIYEYAQQWVTTAGVATDMITTNHAICLASQGPFRVHHGPAYRIENQTSKPFFGEFLLEIDEKSGRNMLQWNCEQKSLPTIHDPGCVITSVVA